MTQEPMVEVSNRLDILIALTKLANRESMRKLREDIEKDPVSLKALELADGSLASNDFKAKVMAVTNVSEGTVKRRVAEMLDLGVLRVQRKGREMYYEDSGLLGG